MPELLQYIWEYVFPGVHFAMSQEHMRLILFTHKSEFLESLTSSCVYTAKSFLFLASSSANRSVSQQRILQPQPWSVVWFYLIQPLLKAERTVKQGQVTQGSWKHSWIALVLANPQPLWTDWATAWSLPCEYSAPLFSQCFLPVVGIFCPSSFSYFHSDKNGLQLLWIFPSPSCRHQSLYLASPMWMHISQHPSNFSYSVFHSPPCLCSLLSSSFHVCHCPFFCSGKPRVWHSAPQMLLFLNIGIIQKKYMYKPSYL